MDRDWLFTGDGYTCDLRAAGVLIRDHKILVQREKDGTEYALPGGHVKIGETLEDALVREMAEETGARVRCVRLLWSEETFWEWNGRQTHTISFYYRMELCDASDLPQTGGLVPQKGNDRVELGWMPVEDLRKAVVYPAFLKDEIDRLNGPIQHFVSKE